MNKQELIESMIHEFYRRQFPFDEDSNQTANERFHYYCLNYLRQNNLATHQLNEFTNEKGHVIYNVSKMLNMYDLVRELIQNRYLFESHHEFIFIFSSYIGEYFSPWADPKNSRWL